TKAIDAERAVAGVSSRLAPGAAVVLLQNGMGFQEAVRQLAPHARLFCAVTTEGAWLEEPFRVRHAGGGGTELGCWPSGNLPAAESIAAELGAGFLPVRAVADVEPLLWRKLAVNCAINPLTALRGCCNGELLDTGHRQEFEALCAEIFGVLHALGHTELAGRVAAEAEGVARATAPNRSSMRQDLDAGRQTEIAFINGFLVERARERGIPCPLNTALVEAIRAREVRGGSTTPAGT
ncbi:MAG: ketopantoate reductase family protein, partial [Gammaproteobacteria bacterium]